MGNSATSSYRAYTTWSNISDGRYKKNLKEDVPGLKFINKLRPVTYTLDATGIDNFLHRNLPANDQLNANAKAAHSKALGEKEQIRYTGFVAQEVEKATKEIGFDFSGVDAPKNANDLYGLRYADFVVPLVKAVQELSQQNDTLNSVNNKQQQQIADLQTRLNKLEAVVFAGQSLTNVSENVELGDAPGLEQNIPNPFNGTTTIAYFLPFNKGNAFINFYSSSGTLLKSFRLNATGRGTINLKAGQLSAGVYQYALVVDGKIIDNKKMIRAN
jgi:hypothetical protein